MKRCDRCGVEFTPHKDWHAYCGLCARHLIRLGVRAERIVRAVKGIVSAVERS